MFLLSFLSRRVSKDQPNNPSLHLILAELISVATIFRLGGAFLILPFYFAWDSVSKIYERYILVGVRL